jgi:4-hydroxy-2-oxoglutarate aldolase
MGYLNLNGVLPPLITPFFENGDIDYGGFVRNIEKWNSDALAGYLVLGSNSEAAYLSEAEKVALLDLAVRHSAAGRVIIAGTGLESTRETLRLTGEAARIGAHAALVLTPCYYGDQMTDAALTRHFVEIADAADIPILVYNVPKFTHVNISPDVVRELSGHPNIVGIKDSTGNLSQLAAFRAVAPEAFEIIVGTAGAWLGALHLGVRAGIHALANCLPNECALLQKLHGAGDERGAQELQKRIALVNTVATGKYGVSGLKAACTLMGYRGGFVRSPLLSLNDEGVREVTDALRKTGFLKQTE